MDKIMDPYVFEDPTTGESVTFQADRHLRNDEIIALAKERWGQPAKLVSRPASPGTPRGIRERIERLGPQGGIEDPVLPGAQPGQHPDWGTVAKEVLIAGAGVIPAVKGLQAGRAMLPHLPRVGQALGGVGGGVASGIVTPLMRMLFGEKGQLENIPSEMAYGGAYGLPGPVAHTGMGFLRRQFRGAGHRVGEEMSSQIGELAGRQVPSMGGLTTGGHLTDWMSRAQGQRGLNTMYQRAKDAVQAHLPPTPSLDLPSLSHDSMTLDQALDAVATKGRAFRTETGSQVSRKANLAGKDELTQALRGHGVPQDAIDLLIETRRQYAMGKGYQTLFRGAGGSTGNFPQRELSPQGLQETLADPKKFTRIERSMGESTDPTELNKLLDIILRGKKDIRTGTYAIGQTDIPPAETIAKALRGYFIHTPEGIKFRAGAALPHGGLFTKYLATPGRLPLESSPGSAQGMAALSQLLRQLRQKPTLEAPAVK